ncbi:MAG: hypothetical protein DWQ34_27225 [Planctomycetota bacterium]|nr:MAG: hypothetical protein DWQ34_27225 [Planctomycetota bacterium]REK28062.1 MAG: hypothetical protein DWQ41_06520 [Planctomycetota bacterium]REK37589.1 MAG: hypothetical protein DWQ45_06205 [Planctomycetota bacterium]
MKHESTEKRTDASRAFDLVGSKYERVKAGPLVANVKRTRHWRDGTVKYSFSLEVHRPVIVDGSRTTVPSFEFRPDDIRFMPMLIRNLAEFFVDERCTESDLHWDLSNISSCLTTTFCFEEWEDDFFKDEDRP